MMSKEDRDNNINFFSGSDMASADFTQKKYISKMKKLAEKHPDECEIYENKDGSIFVRFPLKWIKISYPRHVTEEQRKAASERFVKYHQDKKAGK